MSETKKAEEKKFTPKSDLRAATDFLEKHVTIDKDTGAMTVPEGVIWQGADELGHPTATAESYEASRRYGDLMTNAAKLLLVEKSPKVFKDQPKVNTTSITVPVHHKDFIHATAHREGSYRDMKTGQQVAFKGELGTAKLEQLSYRPKSETAGMKSLLREVATDLLG